MTTHEASHHLVDALPEPALWRAGRLLIALEDEEAALSAVLRDAPLDDEEETDEERAAVAEARSEMATSRGGVGRGDLRRELAL